MSKLWHLTAIVGLAACTSAGNADSQSAASGKDAWMAARPSGKPENCLWLPQIRESRVRNDRTIDFYTRNGRVYRNVLPYSCPSLGIERAFSYATSLSQLCSTDIITVIHQGGGPIAGAKCGLGSFQPVEGAPR
jgi:hypothetical protein